MPEHRVTLAGGARVRLAAYGLADAERQVEKEVRAAWPEAEVDVVEVARTEGAGRIVEEFAVRYRLKGSVTVEAADAAEARRSALRMLHERFEGTRHARIAWDPE